MLVTQAWVTDQATVDVGNAVRSTTSRARLM